MGRIGSLILNTIISRFHLVGMRVLLSRYFLLMDVGSGLGDMYEFAACVSDPTSAAAVFMHSSDPQEVPDWELTLLRSAHVHIECWYVCLCSAMECWYACLCSAMQMPSFACVYKI